MVSAGLGDNALVESKRWVEQRSLSVLIHSEASNRRRLSDFALKSSTEAEATLMFVDDHALLNHATTGSGRDVATFSAELDSSSICAACEKLGEYPACPYRSQIVYGGAPRCLIVQSDKNGRYFYKTFKQQQHQRKKSGGQDIHNS